MESPKVAFDLLPAVLLREFLPLVHRQSDPRALCRETVAFLTERIGAEGGVWLSLDSKGGFFVKGAFGEGLEALRGSPWDPPAEVGARLRDGRPVTLSSLHLDPLFSRARRDGQVLLAPLLTGGLLRGALGALFSSPPWPLEDLQEAMAWIGGILAPALALCSLWEELSVDEILERKVESALGNLSVREGNLLREITEIVERRLIGCVIEKVGRNQSAAARLLGVNRNTLRKKLKEYGLLP